MPQRRGDLLQGKIDLYDPGTRHDPGLNCYVSIPAQVLPPHGVNPASTPIPNGSGRVHHHFQEPRTGGREADCDMVIGIDASVAAPVVGDQGFGFGDPKE